MLRHRVPGSLQELHVATDGIRIELITSCSPGRHEAALRAVTPRYAYIELIIMSSAVSAMCCDVCMDGSERHDLTESVSTLHDAEALWEPRTA